jgi:hypothetical protein
MGVAIHILDECESGDAAGTAAVKIVGAESVAATAPEERKGISAEIIEYRP